MIKHWGAVSPSLRQTIIGDNATGCCSAFFFDLISVVNKTTDPECLDILYEQIELISGRKFKRPKQLSFNLNN